MSNTNPVPSPTPLPSAWDSAIIRNIAFALLALIGTIVADLFGIDATLIMEKGGRLIDAAITFAIVATPLYLAYRARKYKATPPITPEAVLATKERERNIAAAPTPDSKNEAAK